MKFYRHTHYWASFRIQIHCDWYVSSVWTLEDSIALVGAFLVHGLKCFALLPGKASGLNDPGIVSTSLALRCRLTRCSFHRWCSWWIKLFSPCYAFLHVRESCADFSLLHSLTILFFLWQVYQNLYSFY